MSSRSDYREVIRKTIHMAGFLVVPARMLLGSLVLSAGLLVLVVAYSVSEILRLEGKRFPLIWHVTRLAARSSETQTFVMQPVIFAAAIFLSLNLLPEGLNNATVAILTLGDGMAAIAGVLFGRRRLPFNSQKTLEGSLVGFCSGFAGSVFFVQPWVALVGASIGTIVESLDLKINDNIAVPLASGLAMLAVSVL